MCTILLLLPLKKIEFFNHQTCSNFLSCLLPWIKTIFQYMYKLFDPVLHHPILLYNFKIPPTHNIIFLRFFLLVMTKYHFLRFIPLITFSRLFFLWLNCQSFCSICKCVNNSYMQYLRWQLRNISVLYR